WWSRFQFRRPTHLEFHPKAAGIHPAHFLRIVTFPPAYDFGSTADALAPKIQGINSGQIFRDGGTWQVSNPKPFDFYLDGRFVIPAMLIYNEDRFTFEVMTIPSLAARNAVQLPLIVALADYLDCVSSARTPQFFWFFLPSKQPTEGFEHHFPPRDQ